MSCQGNKIVDTGHSELLKKMSADKEILFDVKKQLPSESTIKQFKLRYKPKEVAGFYIDIEHHYKEGNAKTTRKSGWFIQGPGDVFFSLSEEYLSEFFEIVEEDIESK